MVKVRTLGCDSAMVRVLVTLGELRSPARTRDRLPHQRRTSKTVQPSEAGSVSDSCPGNTKEPQQGDRRLVKLPALPLQE